MNREVDFMRSLLQETNKAFDDKIWRSVKRDVAKPTVVSYQLVSFVFYYPTGVPYAPSATEMAQPDELVFVNDSVHRKATTNEVPANYVRVLDAHRKTIGVQLDLLLAVAPLDKPNDLVSLRRSFRFVYRNGWNEE